MVPRTLYPEAPPPSRVFSVGFGGFASGVANGINQGLDQQALPAAEDRENRAVELFQMFMKDRGYRGKGDVP